MTHLVVGEALVDIVTRYDGSVVTRAGGSPTNVAVGLHRLGLPTQLLTALGADAHGAMVRTFLEGVDVLVSPLAETARAHATLDASGSATYVFDIAWDISDAPAPKAPEWLHVGSIATALQPGAEQVAALVVEHAGRCRISFDPNCRPLLMGSPAQVLPLFEELVRHSDVVKLSDEDAEWLFPGAPLVEVARAWQALGPELVVVTRGGDGAIAVHADEVLEVGVPAGAAVVDTVGAGDAFMSGLIAGLSHGREVPAALTLAALTARRTCERVGADPPTAGEVGFS